MAFGFGNLGGLQQRLGQIGNDGYLMDDMSGGAIGRAQKAMPMAAPMPQQGHQGQGGDVPPSDVGTVQTGLPKLGGASSGGSSLSSMFDELFGSGDAAALLAG